MALGAIRLIPNISDPRRGTLLEDFYLERSADDGLFLRNDVNSAELYPVRKTSVPDNGWFWDSVPSLNPDYLLLGIGDPDGVPEDGKFRLAWDADTFSDLDFDISESDLQTTLNAGTAIAAAGDVAVKMLSEDAYEVTFNNVGARPLFTGDPSELSPECNVSVSYLVEGDAETKCVQLIQLIQRPYIFINDWEEIGAIGVVVTELRAGSAGAKALYQIVFSGFLYSGAYSIAGSSPIPWNAIDEALILAALGNEWGSVVASIGALTIERAANGIYSLEEDGVDISGLVGYAGFRGKMQFNSAALFKRFVSEAGASFQTQIQIRYDDGTYRETLYLGEITITKDVLAHGALAPTNWNNFYYRPSEIDAMFARFVADTRSLSLATGDDHILGVVTKKFTQVLIALDGGPDVTTIAIPTIGAQEGDEMLFEAGLPDVAGHTLTINGASAESVAGLAQIFNVTARLVSGAWRNFNPSLRNAS